MKTTILDIVDTVKRWFAGIDVSDPCFFYGLFWIGICIADIVLAIKMGLFSWKF